MSESDVKLLCFALLSGLAFIYALRRKDDHSEIIRLRQAIESEDERKRLEEIIRNIPLDDLVRHANDRLRNRRDDRGPDGDE